MNEKAAVAERRTRPAKARLYRRAPVPRPLHVTSRDVAVLEALWRHRGLSGDQLRRLVLHCGPSMARRRLRALFDHGLIERVRLTAAPTAGLPPFLYTLTRRGADALPDLLAQYRPDLLVAEEVSPTVANLAGVELRFAFHRYLVNEVHVVLEEAARDGGHRLEWRHEESLTLSTEPGRPRAERVEHPLLREPMTFLPDAYFVVRTARGDSFAYFLELDRATHPQRVWRDRARLYAAYADRTRGFFRQRFGRETFRLAIVTTPDYRRRSRRDNILRSIREAVGASDMFLATTFDALQRNLIFGPVWRAADGREQNSSLVDNAPVVVRARETTRVAVRPGVERNRAIV